MKNNLCPINYVPMNVQTLITKLIKKLLLDYFDSEEKFYLMTLMQVLALLSVDLWMFICNVHYIKNILRKLSHTESKRMCITTVCSDWNKL